MSKEELQVKKITAYECPFCGYYSSNKDKVLMHAKTCKDNPNYVQECLHCHCLMADFEHRIMFPEAGHPYCCQLFDGGTCPYKHHTDVELMKHINEKKNKLRKFGIVENEQGELVWENELENKNG